MFLKSGKRLKIAFGYKMGVGKDEACAYLLSTYGGKQVSIAKPLYDIQYYAQKRLDLHYEKDRKFLQFIGNDWARKKDANILLRQALKQDDDKSNIFISDLRYINEFYNLKDNSYHCVKIIRPHQEERKGSGTHLHQSENELDSLEDDEWDTLIYNTSSIQYFYKQLNDLVKKLDE